MRKYTPYFRHYGDESNDERLQQLINSLGVKGYGAYWFILEQLERRADKRASCNLLIGWAQRIHVHASFLRKIIDDFGLFIVNNSEIYSFKLEEEKEKTEKNNSTKNENSRSLGGVKDLKTNNLDDARAGAHLSSSSSTEEREIENKKITSEKTPENKSAETETSALAETETQASTSAEAEAETETSALAETETQASTSAETSAEAEAETETQASAPGILPPVFLDSYSDGLTSDGYKPLEQLLQEMLDSDLYMEAVAFHSGMGVVFLEKKKRIVELFKAHLYLQGKEHSVFTEQDLRAYFTNYTRMGSITCRQLIATLKVEERHKQELSCQGSGPDSAKIAAEIAAEAQQLKKHPNACDACDELSAEAKVYQFEERDEAGNRSYNGYPIPAEAPPRPSIYSVWNVNLKRWGY